MKIGQFCDTFLPIVDGVGRVVFSYADILAKKGNEVYLVCPMDNFGYRGGLPFDIVDFHGVPLAGSPQYRVGMPITDTHYLERISKIKLDVIHAHSPFVAGAEAIRIAHKQKIPLVGTFHSKYYDDFYKATGLKLAAEMGTKYVVSFFKRCDEVWAVSRASADVLEEYGYRGTIQVMQNGVISSAADQSAALEVSNRFSLGELPVILFVGQMNWKKNIRTLMDACALLNKDGREFRLVLAGQGPDTGEITEYAKTIGIDGITVFAGHMTDDRLLGGLYLRSAVFAFLSLYDNAPMVVREAAVMGTPALMVRGSSAAEIVTDGDNGLLCDNTPESACEALRRAVFDPSLLGSLGTRARETIPISWEYILDEAEGRYRALIDAKTLRKRRITARNK